MVKISQLFLDSTSYNSRDFEKLLKFEVASQNEANEAHSQRLILESRGHWPGSFCLTP